MTKRIPCPTQNHQRMPYEYICQEPKCVLNKRTVACINCCHETHSNHLQYVQSSQVFLHGLKALSKQLKKRQYGILDILLKGVTNCNSQLQLKQTFAQLISFKNNPEKFQHLVDREVEQLKTSVQNYFEDTQRKDQVANKNFRSAFDGSSDSYHVNFIKPVFNFKEGKQYILKSPFIAQNTKQGIRTVFAYPCLSKFDESVQVNIKTTRVTPNWLGVGVSFGRNQYCEQSPSHIVSISNGWASNCGQKTKNGIRFGVNDTVNVKWDKPKQLIQFQSNGNKSVFRLQNKWDRQVYLCLVMFYKGDSVQIIS